MHSRWLRWPAAFLLLAILLGCTAEHPDYALELGGGYRLVRANRHEIFISDSTQTVVVPGRITHYALVNDLVVGLVKRPDWPDKEAQTMFPDVVEGYFLVNTTSGTRKLGMTFADLAGSLRESGIDESPTLKEPQP